MSAQTDTPIDWMEELTRRLQSVEDKLDVLIAALAEEADEDDPQVVQDLEGNVYPVQLDAEPL